MADKALTAAHAQHTTLPTQTTGAVLVARLATKIITLDADIAALDAEITQHLTSHDGAEIIISMPGFGPLLAATCIANTVDLKAFGTADRLACDGRFGTQRHTTQDASAATTPRRYNRRLMRTCYLAAFSSLKISAASRAFYAANAPRKKPQAGS